MNPLLDRAWRLPWEGAWVPHAVLDVIRGCNLRCRGCINTRSPEVKALEAVEADLDGLVARRRLSSLTILGGEPRLHPDIARIVGRVKARGVAVELLTNGLRLEDAWLRSLKEAGLDILYVHLDGGQPRPDLPQDPGASDLVRAWTAAAARIAAQGLDVGLAITLYRDRLEDVVTAFRFVLESPHVHYLLVTLYRDSDAIEGIRGDIVEGMTARMGPAPSAGDGGLTNHEIVPLLQERLGLRPFGVMGSNVDPADPRWVSYLVAAAVGDDGPPLHHSILPSAVERAWLGLQRLTAGRYPMYQRQDPARFATQVRANAWTGGDQDGNLRFLAQTRGRPLWAKRMLVQCPAQVGPDGRVIYCRSCPDAVLLQGRLVPICIADRVDNG